MFTCFTPSQSSFRKQSSFRNVFGKTLRVSLLTLLASGLLACAPRGETKTLGEILKNSQAYYQEAAADAKPSANAEAELKALTEDLNSLVATKTVASADIAKIAARIAKLIPLAGYTNRPGFTQLERQWVDLSKDDLFSKNTSEKPRAISFEKLPSLSLLAARTYRTLARELETTGFRV